MESFHPFICSFVQSFFQSFPIDRLHQQNLVSSLAFAKTSEDLARAMLMDAFIIHSFIYSSIWPYIQSIIHSLDHWFIHSINHSINHSFTWPFIPSSNPFTHASKSFILSSIAPSIHPSSHFLTYLSHSVSPFLYMDLIGRTGGQPLVLANNSLDLAKAMLKRPPSFHTFAQSFSQSVSQSIMQSLQ